MGLFDRDYMNYGRSGGGIDSGRNVLWGLIAVNAVMFLLIAPPGSRFFYDLAMICSPGRFGVYQLLTAGFIHGSFGHILFNMYGLYIFGTLVLPHLGGKRFLWLYLAGVLCGNLLFLLVNWGRPGLLLGASGAVCAVMMAAAMLEPERRFMMLFLPFTPLKTPTLVICYTILEILMELSGADAGIAHLAHLGGFIGGYLLVKLLLRGNVAWDPFRRRRSFNWKQPGGERNGYYNPPPPPRDVPGSDAPVSRRELDALLDKISRGGINSLSPEELARLKRAREEMRR